MLGMWIRRSGYGQIRGKWVDQKYQNLCLATFFTRFGLSIWTDLIVSCLRVDFFSFFRNLDAFL